MRRSSKKEMLMLLKTVTKNRPKATRLLKMVRKAKLSSLKKL